MKSRPRKLQDGTLLSVPLKNQLMTYFTLGLVEDEWKLWEDENKPKPTVQRDDKIHVNQKGRVGAN